MKIENNIDLSKISLNPVFDNAKEISGNVSNTFDDFYKAALDVLNETSKQQHQATRIQQDFAAGRTDDILAVMMAQEKAYSSLQFTVQVTNKIVEAYREIMRIQL